MTRRNTDGVVGTARARTGHVQKQDVPVKLLLVFPGTSLVRKAVRAGLDVHALIGHDRRDEEFPLAGDRLFRFGQDNGAGHGDVISRLIEEHGFTHVLDAEGLPLHGPRSAGAPEAAATPSLLADVHAFRRALSGGSRAIVRERTVTTAEKVPAAVAELGGEVVIRTGSDEQTVRTAEALDAWVRAAGSGPLPGPVVVEELVAGTEVVVTTLTVNGMHRVIGITEQYPAANGTRYVYPANLTESEAVPVRAAVTGMLDLVDYEFGPAQTRVVLTGGEPYIVQAKPCFSIYRISALLETATGFDIHTELFRALAGASIEPPRPRWFAATEFSGPGTDDEPAADPVRPGDPGAGTADGVVPERHCPAEGVSAEAALGRLSGVRPA